MRLCVAIALAVAMGVRTPSFAQPPTKAPTAKAPAGKAPTAKAPAAKPAAPPQAPAQGKHALLVGCTQYHHLKVQTLEGPANDLVLMRELLAGRFKFPTENIVTLAETQDERHKPTRANIEREFARLAEKVHMGDQVVIQMSGHGTQQPDSDPPDPLDPEPDGMDEVFLPADAKPYDRKLRVMPGAIVDDELGRWVARIRNTGAAVWIIVDSCHSGTIVRGGADEITRRVPPEQIIPRDELEAARDRAAKLPRTRGDAAPPSLAGDLSGVVALYAAQPEQTTIELPLPRDGEASPSYGLLTYTLNQVLNEARSTLTYRELAERIQAEYVREGYACPTPLLEGVDRDREVLGINTWPHRSAITLRTDGPRLRISAGSLYGLTRDSILRVYPPAGAANPDQPLGHVRVGAVEALAADVIPCDYDNLAAPTKLPNKARCELVYVDCGLHQLRVAVEVPAGNAQRNARAAIEKLAAEQNALLTQAADRQHADWVLHAEADEIYLEPASGLFSDDLGGTPRFGPVAADDQLPTWLADHLRRIARAQNLLSLVKPNPAERDDGGLGVRMELVRLRDKEDKAGTPIPWTDRGITLSPGDRLGCCVTNQGRAAADVTLLFVDAGYGIKAVFPRTGTVTDNRVFPGESIIAFRGTVNDRTKGLEHLVMIAVPGEGTPNDFSALEQPTLALSRSASSESRSMQSPLGALLQSAMYGGGTRGLDADEVPQQQFSLASWRVVTSPAIAARP